MIQFITQNLAPIMFAGLIFFLLIGFPVAFSLGACGCSSPSSASSWGCCPPR